jgi:5-methylcytosine-specific restriction enzyme subunit McrC
MALISVQEYKSLRIGEFDPAGPSVTEQQADLLTNLKATYGFEVFKYANKTTLVAQQYVGVFQLGPHTVEVLPKIDGDVRRNLVAMLAVALDLDISEGDVARVATQNHGILEILIRLFCDKLFAQVHRGLVRRYEGREENLSVLRGKLGVVEQVRLNAANPERLFCRFDEFQEDNPLNQILKAAIRLLLKVSRELKNQRQLAELLLVLEGASNCPRASLPWHRVVFDRMSNRYKPCFKLAELFLRKTPPDVSGGGVQGFSLFFDMNVLFENYIGRMAIRAFRPLGYQVTLQGPKENLAIDETLNRAAFALQPDVVGRLNSQVAWILDTKWKSLAKKDRWNPLSTEKKDAVAQSDFYQMYAYANRYDCPDVVLLYPHYKELGLDAGVRGSYLLNPWIQDANNQQRKRVRVATINLENLNTVREQLEKILLPESSVEQVTSTYA